VKGNLEGKVALVSGSGQGIGRAIALKLAQEGARVVVNDLDATKANAVVKEITDLGGSSVTCCGSVTEDGFAENFVNTALEAFGGLDIIINNAGYTWDNVVQKMTDEQWHAILDVHLTAPFKILRAAQPVIKKLVAGEREQGIRNVRKVVNISSVAGQFGNAGQSNYSAAKAGIMGMTQSLAKEWGRINTTVNCVSFALIRTRLNDPISEDNVAKIEGRDIKMGVPANALAAAEASIPLGRGGTTEEAAGAVYLLTTPESDYISGQTLLCSGGLTGF